MNTNKHYIHVYIIYIYIYIHIHIHIYYIYICIYIYIYYSSYHYIKGGSIWDSELSGIVPRCVNKLFQEIEKVEHSVQFQIVVSFYEIYCEKVRDLLSPQQVNMKVSLVDMIMMMIVMMIMMIVILVAI